MSAAWTRSPKPRVRAASANATVSATNMRRKRLRLSSGDLKEPRARRGAPAGNPNALKHGKFTRERRALLAEIRAYIRRGRALVAQCGFSGHDEMSRSPRGTCP